MSQFREQLDQQNRQGLWGGGGIFCPAAIAVLLVMSRGSIVGKCFIFFLYGLVTNTNEAE